MAYWNGMHYEKNDESVLTINVPSKEHSNQIGKVYVITEAVWNSKDKKILIILLYQTQNTQLRD
jgi:hypothetical protein